MNKTRAEYLFQKYYNKMATEPEREELLKAIRHTSEEEILSWMKNAYDADMSEDFSFTPIQRTNFLAKAFEQESSVTEKKERRMLARRWISNWVSVAAVLVLCFGIAFYLLKNNSNKKVFQKSKLISAQIKPGGQKALLTLDNGSTILLEERTSGKIAEESGFVITKTKDGQLVYTDSKSIQKFESKPAYNTVTTPRGGNYTIVLPDGTKVWLNAASSLRYPSGFSGKTRTVTLEGEAYFEVAKNKLVSFKVLTKNQVVTVLGTHFNINSYDSNTIKTTLAEGAVEIETLPENENRGYSEILKPGQQASTNANSQIAIRKVNVSNILAWKSGLFQFENTKLLDVLNEFSRWYDIDFELEGKIPDIKLWGRVYRNVNAGEALDILSYFNLKYRIVEAQDSQGGSRKKVIVFQN